MNFSSRLIGIGHWILIYWYLTAPLETIKLIEFITLVD